MKKFIGADPQGLLRAILFPAVASVVLSIAVGWLAIQRIDEAYLAGRENAFNLETSEIALKIEERFKAYRQVLRGARALFAASREVTRAEWKEYVSGLRLQAVFGGILGVGFAVGGNAPLVPTLDVIFSQTSTPLTPEQADFLAQANQQGGGDHDTPQRPRDSQAGIVPRPDDGIAPRIRRRQTRLVR